MNALFTIALAALIFFILSSFTRTYAIRVALVTGAFIAGGWVLDDVTSGTGVNWTITKDILVFAMSIGAAWELTAWILRTWPGKPNGR